MDKRFTALQGVMSLGGRVVNNYSEIHVKNGKWHEAIATQEMYGNEELEKVFMENGGVIVPHHEVDYEFFQLLPEKIQTTIKDIKKEYEELRKVAYMPSEVHYEYNIYLGTTDMLPKVSVSKQLKEVFSTSYFSAVAITLDKQVQQDFENEVVAILSSQSFTAKSILREPAKENDESILYFWECAKWDRSYIEVDAIMKALAKLKKETFLFLRSGEDLFDFEEIGTYKDVFKLKPTSR